MRRLDVHFRALTGACFARHGHGYAEVLGNWAAIVGDELAAIALPERLRRDAAGGMEGGAMLIVRAREGRALEVQHQSARIVERINGFLGYRAVQSLKVLQGPLPERKHAPHPAEPDDGTRRDVEARVGAVADPRLKDALRRLGCSLAVSNTSR